MFLIATKIFINSDIYAINYKFKDVYAFNAIIGVKLMKNKKIFNTIFREKPAMMLVGLYNAKGEVYASALAKAVDCTYSHVVKILSEMQKSGLINFEKSGRLKLLTLTKLGAEVAESIEKVRQIL